MIQENVDALGQITRQRLKELRKSRSMSLEQFAQAVGVQKTTVRHWENGDFKSLKLSTTSKIADYFGVNPLWIMGYDVPKYSSFKNQNLDNNQSIESDIIDKLHLMNKDQLIKVNKFIDDFILDKDGER